MEAIKTALQLLERYVQVWEGELPPGERETKVALAAAWRYVEMVESNGELDL